MKTLINATFVVVLVAVLPVSAQEQYDKAADLSEQTVAPRGCPLVAPLEVEIPLLSDEDRALVREALNLDGAQRFPVCAYKANSDSNRHSKWVEQYIPNSEDASDVEDSDQLGWQLVTVEGSEPTEKELRKYRHRGGALYPYLRLNEMIDFSQLQVADRTANRVVFETRPTTEFLEDRDAKFLQEHVTTTLVIDSDTRRIDFVVTKLAEEIKPNAFIRVYEFDQYLDYSYIPRVGEVILTELQMHADVKFVVLKRQFFLSAELFDFSCPAVLQPDTCEEPSEPTLD